MSQQRQVLTVSLLNAQVRDLLENSFLNLWIEGEVSNLSVPSSGHIYFTLKDKGAQIRAAMFRGNNRFLRFTPKDGQQVVVKAKLSLYAPRGDYQLIVEQMEEAGLGALQRAYEELRLKLKAEGLFDQEKKRPLPAHIRHLAVITSPTGAALQDILSVLGRRFPGLPITVIPSPVQGKEAPAALLNALRLANQQDEFDVILLARGGGSLEDLWAFNDEALARAIAESRLPVINGVGHETDFTIADFVADLRAPTPSAAAELLSQDAEELLASFQGYETLLQRAMFSALQNWRQRIQFLHARLRHPGQRLQELMQRLDGLETRLHLAQKRRLTAQQGQLAQLNQRLHLQHPKQRVALLFKQTEQLTARLHHAWHIRLQRQQSQLSNLTIRLHNQQPGAAIPALQKQTEQLSLRLQRAWQVQFLAQQTQLKHLAERAQLASPLAILGRGYAVAENERGLIRSITQLKTGDTVKTSLSDGHFYATVSSCEKS